MNTNGVVQAAASFAAVLLLSACSSVEPVAPIEPYTVRLAGYQGTARVHSGSSMATDGKQETPLTGDQMDFDRDMGFHGSVGQRGVVEARLSADSELRGSFDRYHQFDGATDLDRTRRFDGTTYVLGTHVHNTLDWNRTTLSYAQRVGAFRGDGAPVDLLVRVGGERTQFLTKVEGNPPPPRDRFAIAGAPFAGVEARIGILPSVQFIPSVDAGYIHNGDKRLALGDAQLELRWNVLGPLDVSASYEFSGRHVTVQRGDGERSDVRSNVSMWLIGVGLHF